MDRNTTHQIDEPTQPPWTAGRVADLLEAFNAAAAMIQRSSHSEAQVFSAFKEQIAHLNLVGLIMMLDETGENLVIRALSQPTDLLDRLKKLVGIEAEGYAIHDGTAKGGIVISICDTLKIPLKYIGIGEKIEDLRRFDAAQFVDALF